MNSKQIEEITRLRQLKLSPKEIARKLNLRSSEVKAVLKEQIDLLEKTRREGKSLAPLEKCLLNCEAAEKLLGFQTKNLNYSLKSDDEENEDEPGLAKIIVSRFENHRYFFACYLIDYYCLGVKEVVGPLRVDSNKHTKLIEEYSYLEDMIEISLTQAQSIIFGAVEYARKLGLSPHPDWENAKGHLGQPAFDLPSIEFGRNGKPFFLYQSNDDAETIIATLKETVGEGNFDYQELDKDSDLTIFTQGDYVVIIDN